MDVMAARLTLVVVAHVTFNLRPVSSEIVIEVTTLLYPNCSKTLCDKRVIPVIDIALKEIKSRHLIDSVRLDVKHRRSHCDSTVAALAAIDVYMRSKHPSYNMSLGPFIGPICDYSLAPVSRYASSWNIPQITTGGLARDFLDSRKSEYHLLTRMGPKAKDYAGFLTKFMERFSYRKVKALYEKINEVDKNGLSRVHFLLTAGIAQSFEGSNITFRAQALPPSKQKYSKILKSSIGTDIAVVVLCASPDSVRDIMLKAHELNFDNGEYVFINIDLFSNKNETERPWYRKLAPVKENEDAKKAYEALMTVTLRKPTSEAYRKFSDDVKERAKILYGKDFDYGEEEVNSFVGAFHDAVILYAIALNETLEANGNITDGLNITRRMWNRTFQGITGDVSMDINGDRNADYSLLDYNPKSGIFEVVANYYGHRKKYEPVKGKKIHWAGGRKTAPPDEPVCGFDGSKCPPDQPFPIYAYISIVLSSLLIITVVSAFLIYRHIKFKADLNEANWKVKWEDIMFGSMDKRKSETSNMVGSQGHASRRMSATSSVHSTDTVAVIDAGNKQLFTVTAYFKGTLVAIKKLRRTNFNINQNALIEVKNMRDLQNDHICRFIAACTEVPNHCLLYEYCQKGSLQDVLENESIKLDWMFRYSLIQDLIRAMEYLHSSEIKSHGNLKSSNCLVDSRFVLKISNFGLHALRDEEDESDINTFPYYQRKLWTSPELLRMQNRPPAGTQKGDIYSFSIICQEIICRNGVFYVRDMDIGPQEIYEKVKKGQKPNFRPTLVDCDLPKPELSGVIQRSWAEDPLERPDFHMLKSSIRKLNKEGDKGNILDNLLNRMEQYANNLETLVEERTSSYLEQKKKAEDLLYMMLPRKVAGQLILGQTVSAEAFECVSIYFSDICGFTAMSARSTPMQVIDLLNDLYSMFDKIIENLDVYKVETIGDAYMVVSGLPERNGNLHAREICRMSLALLSAIFTFKIRHLPTEQIKLRIGLHSGSVCSGVVGHKMPRYCLFGDTVNTASRMESNGLPLRIHLSPETEETLREFKTFITEPRGLIEMKGKGKIATYWLLGERPDGQPPYVVTTTLSKADLLRRQESDDQRAIALAYSPTSHMTEQTLPPALSDKLKEQMDRNLNHTDPSFVAVDLSDSIDEDTPLIAQRS